MKSEKKNPATLAASRARNSDCLAALNKTDNSNHLPQLQQLRAHFLARRFAVSPDLAVLIATLALGEVSA
jgi:hypothetical protein